MDQSAPLTSAEIRLAQYGERTKTWSTATYDSGTEKALHQIALELRETIQHLRATLAEVRSDAGAKIRVAAEHVHAARAERDRLRGELAQAIEHRDHWHQEVKYADARIAELADTAKEARS